MSCRGRILLVAATVTGIAIVALAVSERWFVLNVTRQVRAGWMTVVDKPVYAPDAAAVYSPLGKVAGASVTPLPRRPAAPGRYGTVRAIAERTRSYAVLVWHQGAVVFEYYGPSAGPDSRPDGASMHKSVTALLVGAAVADGSIRSVDDPVGRYLPGWRGRPEGQVTVAQLLQMASGLGQLSVSGGFMSEANRFLGGLRPTDLALGSRLERAPGTEFAYRNVNTFLLGLVIEGATGQRYATYLSRRLWQPLGGADAFVWLNVPGGAARTYTALLARPEDWLRLGLLVKDRGTFAGRQVLPSSWIDAMLAPSRLYPNYGYQVWLARPYLPRRYYNPAHPGLFIDSREPIRAPDMAFFDGVGGQRVYVSRALDLVVLRLGVALPDWDDAELPNAVIEALQAPR